MVQFFPSLALMLDREALGEMPVSEPYFTISGGPHKKPGSDSGHKMDANQGDRPFSSCWLLLPTSALCKYHGTNGLGR